MTNYLTSNKTCLLLILSIFSNISFASTSDIDNAVSSFSDNHPNVNISIVSYGKAKRHCPTELKIKSKRSIKPSSRWILKVICSNRWKANISARTEVLHRRYTATRDIYPGDKIGLSSVKFSEIWSDQQTTNYIDVLGKVAKSKISKGMIVRPYNLSKSYLVKKKQRIMVVLKSNTMNLKINAIALEPGNIYDIIEVMNVGSKKKIFAKIISKSEAILE